MSTALFRNAAAHADGFRDVDPLLLWQHLADAAMIDVRESHELTGELGHIRGVRHVPLATVATAAQHWDREEPVVMICRSGGRSANAARVLVQMGFTRVMNLRGGMLAWNAVNLPVDRTAHAHG